MKIRIFAHLIRIFPHHRRIFAHLYESQKWPQSRINTGFFEGRKNRRKQYLKTVFIKKAVPYLKLLRVQGGDCFQVRTGRTSVVYHFTEYVLLVQQDKAYLNGLTHSCRFIRRNNKFFYGVRFVESPRSSH